MGAAVTEPADGVTFGLLGPLVVQYEGVPRPVARGKQRAVLAALLLSANQIVPVDDLVDVLWPAEPPRSARVTLQNYVKRLRSTLHTEGNDRITTHPRGYRIRVEAGELDVARFEEQISAARAGAKADAWGEARARAVQALSLWRGKPLADIDSELLGAREAPRLAELRLQAMETRLDADLHLGGHADALPELRQLASAYPLREQPTGLLMLALYRCGRQAEALAVYRDARDVLIEEIGAEPGAWLRQLHQRILSGDPALEVPRSARPALAGVFPRELPAAAAHFVGRGPELAALTEVSGLADVSGLAEVSRQVAKPAPGHGSVAVICGTPGVGKTALALQWAHQQAGRYPDGQLYVNLRGYDPDQPVSAAEALAGFLRALGVPGQEIPAETAERAARYRSMLAGRRMLVVLDNAGQVDQVRLLLPAAPGCQVLVTSRDSLAGLVARDGARRLALDQLPLPDAIELLRTLIGGRVEEDVASAAELAVQCARLPLALRIAAEIAVARPGTSLADLVESLADQQRRLDLLTVAKDQHTMMRSVFSWSYRELDASAARGFRLAGLQPAPDFDRYAFAALTDAAAGQAGHVLDVLGQAHLIQLGDTGRYGLHDLLRAYAGELAVSEGEDERIALTRLFDYYLGTAAAAMDVLYPAEQHHRPRIEQATRPARPLSDPGAAREWLDAERGCLVAIAEYAGTRGWPGHATRIAATLGSYLDLGGYFPEARAIHEHALHAAQSSGEGAAAAVALSNLGIVDLRQGRFTQAAGHLRRSLALCREAGDEMGQARAFNNLALIDDTQGRHDLAAGHLRRSLALLRKAGDRFGEARTLFNLGKTAQELGQYQQASSYLQQALVLCGQIGDSTGVGFSLCGLGEVHLLRGRHDEATANYQRALALFGETGNRHGEAVAHNGLGAVLLAASRPEQARSQYAAALSLATGNGVKYEQARAQDGLARAHEATSDTEQARHHWREALSLYTDLGAPEVERVRAKLGEAGLGVPF